METLARGKDLDEAPTPEELIQRAKALAPAVRAAAAEAEQDRRISNALTQAAREAASFDCSSRNATAVSSTISGPR